MFRFLGWCVCCCPNAASVDKTNFSQRESVARILLVGGLFGIKGTVRFRYSSNKVNKVVHRG